MSAYVNNYYCPAIKINSSITPSGTISINTAGLWGVYSYSSAEVDILDRLDIYATSTFNALNLSIYEDLNASKINAFAFASRTLSGINMPNVESIGMYAFYNTEIPPNISITLSFPKCTSIGASAFARTVNAGSSKYLYINLPNSQLSILPSSCFANNYGLVEINMPYFYSTAGMGAFYNCINLTSINFPSLYTTQQQTFCGCNNLESVSVPRLSHINHGCFNSCYKLSTISLPNANWIGAAFQSCYNLLSVYLNISTVPYIDANAFSSTPISNYTTSTGGIYGSIYVPTSLYSAFLSSTNWAKYSARIVSMNF